MHKGPALGAAIESAMHRKGVSRSAMARHFDVKPESTYDWTKHGRIAKDRLPALFEYFADVAGPEHWGIAPGSFGFAAPSQPVGLDLDRMGLALTAMDKALSDMVIQGRLGTLAEALAVAYKAALKIEDAGSPEERAMLDSAVEESLRGWVDGRGRAFEASAGEDQPATPKAAKGRRGPK